MRGITRLPSRFPVGTKYVLEDRGPFVRRYVEFPNGRKVQLELRKAQTCTCAARHGISIVPTMRVADGAVANCKHEVKPRHDALMA